MFCVPNRKSEDCFRWQEFDETLAHANSSALKRAFQDKALMESASYAQSVNSPQISTCHKTHHSSNAQNSKSQLQAQVGQALSHPITHSVTKLEGVNSANLLSNCSKAPMGSLFKRKQKDLRYGARNLQLTKFVTLKPFSARSLRIRGIVNCWWCLIGSSTSSFNLIKRE